MTPSEDIFSGSHFAERVNLWTLRFLDPKQEELYQNTLDTNIRFPWLMQILTYVLIVLHCGYRCITLLSAATTRFIPCGSVTAESSTLTFLVVCVLGELLFLKDPKCRCLRGSCFYCGSTIVAIAASFYTHHTPCFGLMYGGG
jgi:hypothetical protein